MLINRMGEMTFDLFYRLQLSDYRHEIEAKREYAGENENYRARTNARLVRGKRNKGEEKILRGQRGPC